MTKVLGSKKQNVRLPPKRGLVKMRILHLIVEIVKKIVIGLPKDGRNVLSMEVNQKQNCPRAYKQFS